MDIDYAFATLYAAFAHLKPGVITSAEMTNIREKLRRWSNGRPDTPGDVSKIFSLASGSFHSTLNEHHRKDLLQNTAIELNGQQWFDLNLKTILVHDLVHIALAGNHLSEKENAWLQIIATEWGVELELNNCLIQLPD